MSTKISIFILSGKWRVLLFGLCCDIISEKCCDSRYETDDEDGDQSAECSVGGGGCGLYGARDGVGACDGVGDDACGVG